MSPAHRERVLKYIIATGMMRTKFQLMLACLYHKEGRVAESVDLLQKVFESRTKLRAAHFYFPFVRDFFADILRSDRIRFRALDHFYAELEREMRHMYVFFITHTRREVYFDGMLEHLGALTNNIFVPMNLVSVDQIAARKVELYPSSEFEFMDPMAFEDKEPRRRRKVKLPAQKVWVVDGAQVLDAFQVTKDGKFIVYEESADPRNGFVAGLWQVAELMKTGDDCVFVDFKYEKRVVLETAVLLSGRCTRNYFHWLIEYMPKFMNIRDSGMAIKGPLLIDAEMPRQHYDIAHFVARKYGFDLLKIEPKTLCVVDALYIPSPCTFHPDDKHFEYWEGGGVSKRHLQFIREEAFEYVASLGSNEMSPRKVYLRRRSAARRIVNEADIEALVERLGFTIVDPAALTFAQQVSLFANADVVMSPAGAALSNVVFMREGATAISMLADYNKGYCMKANIANAVGVHFFHITGELLNPREYFESYDEFRFSEFKMDIAKIERALVGLDLSTAMVSGTSPDTSHSLP